jgi:ABC-type antimicrobial peptide transport system ATPase subunit
LQRVIAYVLGFLYNLKQGAASSRHGPLTSAELHKSLIVIGHIVQHSAFAREIQNLQQGKALPSHSKLLTLHSFLDGNNLLRVGSRLENTEVPFDQKHPLILPHKHVTKLLTWSEHV